MIFKELPNDSHFSDYPTEPWDTEIGDEIAANIGDLMLEVWHPDRSPSPVELWTAVVKALRLHGLHITERERPDGTA